MGTRLDDSRIIDAEIPMDLIDPHKNNYNEHPEEQLKQLANSHHNFGQYRRMLVWAQPNGRYIQVAGHGFRHGAIIDGRTTLRVEVLPADTDPLTIEAIMAADNLHAKNSEPDERMLADLLLKQEDAGFDLRSMGTDSETLRQMLEALGAESGIGKGDDDEFDPTPEEDGPTRTHVGELWALGKHRLFVGDCTVVENVECLMDGEQAHCCWTDPPYGVSYVGKTKDALTIQNDGKEDLDSFLRRAFLAMDVALADGAAIYIAHPAGALSVTYGLRFLAQGWRLHETLVWVKDSMVLGHSDYHYKHEPILFGYKAGIEGRYGRGGQGWYGDNCQVSVFDIPRPKRSEEHPTMKPIALIEAMLANSCERNGLVYDPFGGSGSTLIAAQRLHMRCNLCELDPRYADVILARYEAECDDQAELLEEETCDVG